MNKKAGFTDLFIFLIFAFIVILFSVVFIYISGTVTDELREKVPEMNLGSGSRNNVTYNATEVIEGTIGRTNASFKALEWISVLIIFGMILGIFIGSHLVKTKPVFFVPYIFIVIIAVVVAVPISNAYETLSENATLSPTFLGFAGANWVMAYLPFIIAVIGFFGGIIMFSNLGKEENQYYG